MAQSRSFDLGLQKKRDGKRINFTSTPKGLHFCHRFVDRHEKLLEANMESEERVENRRFLRRLQQENKEREMAEALKTAEERRILSERQREQEERLAKELERCKLESTRDEKLRQQIRENSIELRQLQAKLRAGYMNRERAAQFAEKTAREHREKAIEGEIVEHMQKEHQKAQEMEREKDLRRWEESVRYHEDLEKQLREQERAKQEQFEEFLKEKLMIDEIVRKIYAEDQKELESRLEKQKATQKYIEEFMKKREEWKEYERNQMEEENRKILEFAKQQQEREEERMMKKKEKESAMSAVQQKLSKELFEKQAAIEEMERIRAELHMEEQEEMERQKDEALLMKRIQQRLDLQQISKEQMDMKRRRKEAEKEEEEEFRRQMLAKFAEDDRIEQMNAQRRRMKQQEHKRAVEQLLDERRRQYQADKEREMQEQAELERMEAFRRQIIEEERQRLLQEHASKLLGYLPKGVLRDDQDLDMFDEDFKRTYRSRRPDPYDYDDDSY
eukprot:gene19520-21450_t